MDHWDGGELEDAFFSPEPSLLCFVAAMNERLFSVQAFPLSIFFYWLWNQPMIESSNEPK